ncbi:RHS repeat-associated core domain-containing protein, partial [Acinetobacter baumannii]
NQFYNHNRFYNPELGRYMEPDPIGLEGGLNPYAYAANNPVMNVDPSGLNVTAAFGGLLYETYNWATGNNFNWDGVKGAFWDGYNGQGSFKS